MSNGLIPGPKRPRMSLPPNFNPGFGMGALTNPIASFPLDDGGSDDEDMPRRKQLPGSKQTAEAKRSQHCEVEKRRREKMNRYMTELSQMIPACSAVPRKLDKLSILRMAVEHMKRLRGDAHSKSDYKPGFLTDDELKQLVVEAANGFMIIISCESARVLFVSDTITQVLNESVNDWAGCSFYDLLHSKDVQKVKEQLACFDVEEALAAGVKQNCGKSPLIMHPHSMNGLRRSFLCRVKRHTKSPEELPDSTTNGQPKDSSQDFSSPENMIRLIHSSKSSSSSKNYAILHCTGFIRNLTPAERQTLQVEQQEVGSCLVAVARLQNFGEGSPKNMMSTNDKEFVTRIGTDGRFTYVDQRVTNILGYLPQDLIGQVSYEYFHRDDMSKMVHLHHEAMKQRSPMPTVHYRFLSNDQKWVWLAMKAFSFINPFSQQVEYVVCTNVAHTKSTDSTEECSSTTDNKDVNVEPTLPSDVASIFPDLTSKIQQWNENRNSVVKSDGTVSSKQQVMVGSTNPVQPSSSTMSNGASSSSSTATSTANDSVIISQPCDVTVEQNAQLAQKILDEYMKNNAPSPHQKEPPYQFPPGLFPSEVDLEGSAQAYHYHIEGLDNQELQQILDQVDADPFKPSNVFGDLDFDFFD